MASDRLGGMSSVSRIPPCRISPSAIATGRNRLTKSATAKNHSPNVDSQANIMTAAGRPAMKADAGVAICQR